MTDHENSVADLGAAERFVVANGLPGVDPGGVAVDELEALLPWAAEHRLVGLLNEAANALGGFVPDVVADANLAILRHAVGVEVAACQAVAVLRSAGVEAVVFKGLGAAHLDYPDPALRSFYDADLLVARHHLDDAIVQLERAGWARVESRLGRDWERRFARAVPFVGPDGIELDLHAALAPGYFGVRLDIGRMMRATTTWELGGVSMTAFDPDARLLVSSFALMLSRGGHLRLVRDVAQQILVSNASVERAASLAGEGDVIIAGALRMTDLLVDLPPEARTWMLSVSPSRRQRHGLALARRARHDGWRSDALGDMLGLGNRERLAYVRGIARSRIGRNRDR